MSVMKNPNANNQHYVNDLQKLVDKVIQEEQKREKMKLEIGQAFSTLAEMITAAAESIGLDKVLVLTEKPVTYQLTGDLGFRNDLEPGVSIKVVTIESDRVTLTFAPDGEITLSDSTIKIAVRGIQKHRMEGNTMTTGGAVVPSSLEERYTLTHRRNTDWSLLIGYQQSDAPAEERLTEAGILRILYSLFAQDLSQ
ncbi:hypothetical protein EXT65_21020 [Pectobacterium carotovorum subsp. carotovorum]|uniref:hypothetical protein n=1 Tax=Pectobacterium versatile TaxID=2488639 RepID=UPI000C7F748F|nr:MULTISPECIES: hypothetical protein [Pectobacterium]MCL6336278.1 hypothetical protein [Pectobacterium carotovorum subsp. carotovorum]PLY35381.1 hypothetical protein F164LOC_20815 [Pectobacterium carotovorum]